MPLTADNIVHQNSGGVAAATSGAAVSVSLTGGDTTSAGNTVFVFLAGGNGQGFSVTPPSGWITVGGANTLRVYARGATQGLAAGESSWNFTPLNATAGPVRWTVFEIENVAAGVLGDIADVVSSFTQASSGTTLAAVTGVSSTYDGLAVSLHSSYAAASTDSWGSHTGGFVEVVEGSQAGSGTDNITLSVSAVSVNQIGTYGATATCSRTLDASNPGNAVTFVLNAAGARKAANLNYLDGAEHGLVTGNTIGPNNATILSTASAGVSVSSGAARSGGFGWLLSATSAACNWTLGAVQSASIGPVYMRHFRFPTLPGADLEFWAVNTVRVRFIQATSKIGMKVGTGTEVVSDQAITANQWFRVDFYRTSTTVDWQIDYNAELTDTTAAVTQTQATGSAGTSVNYTVGWTTSSTATMHTDDAAAGPEKNHYPFGDLRVLPLKVDPAATPTVSGSTANFGVMTANGTVGAWNAANARNAIDDVPPDLSGTRDAAVCVTAHATDYAEFAMETRDLAANKENARGVRWVAAFWAASATAATIRLNVYSGATLLGGTTEQDPNTDNTSTPAWGAGMVKPASGRIDWTQQKLDDLVVRMGSNDATPDIGIDCVLLEVAVAKAQPEVLFGEPGSLYVEASRDPDTQGLVGFTATVPGGEATIDYEVNGTPSSAGPVSFDNSPYYQAITDGGTDFPTVNKISMNPV